VPRHKRGRVPGTRKGSTLFVLPSIPDALDEATKSGLAIRNACAVEGRCPACGVEPELARDPEYPALLHVTFRHEDECPVLRDDPAWTQMWERGMRGES
jgi:hypothetical protein